MKVYEIDPSNFGNYKHLMSDILNKPNMCGVFSQSCGHCEAMKPEWNKLKSAIQKIPGNGSLIEIDSNVVPEIQHMPLREKITGYPTILILKKGIPKMEYSGNRSFQDMYDYFKKNVNQESIRPPLGKITLKKIKKKRKRLKRSRNQRDGKTFRKKNYRKYKRTMKKHALSR